MPNSTLTVGALSAAPGTKVFGFEEGNFGGVSVRFGIFLINGAEPGPTLVVTGGVHAAEYASIAAALDLGRNLLPQSLKGRVIVLPVVNVPGFGPRSIYINPLDGKNINRCFPGDPNGTASEQLAHWIFQNLIKLGDYYVDLHGGDLVEALVPFSIWHASDNAEVDRVSLEMAKVFGIPYIVRSESQNSAYSSAARAGIPAMLSESGGQGIWLPEHVADHTNGLARLMRHLGMVAGPAPQPVACTLFERFVWLRSDHDGFWYPRVQVGDVVQEGQDVGAVMDYAGNVLQPAVAPASGPVLFLVTSLAINKDDPFLAVGA
jgi:predicted deacylase